MSEKLNELYILTQKAQKMEMINEEIALKLYLEIFENHTPKISKTYESAIRLLEKRHRYAEALKICNMAIELINASEVSGIVDRFESTRVRLERKMKDEVPESTEPVKRKFVWRLKHFIFIAIFVIVIVLLVRYQSNFDDLDVNLDGKESLEGGTDIYRNTTEDASKSFPVTEEMIALATRELLKNNDAAEATVIPQGGTLGIAIIVSPGTASDRGKQLAEYYLKALAGAAAAEYPELTGPTDTSLGQLYSYYELVITVGVTRAEEDYIASGTKGKAAKTIYWK